MSKEKRENERVRARFTGADLVKLIRSLPPVDEDYLSDVEEISRTQPSLPESPRDQL